MRDANKTERMAANDEVVRLDSDPRTRVDRKRQ